MNWVLSESLEGELNTLVPIWEKNGHAVFTQGGVVFWSGIEEERRIDGNIGAVYRTEVYDGVIGGVNLFYDYDFEIGHSRIGFGVDAQKDGFYGAFNYYLPQSDTQDGREGYVEDALEGMDAILGVESDVVRFSGNVGYWTYQGDEDTEDEMEFSYGIDGGVRLFPGLFLEGSLQHHDKASIGRRASVGVAVRFSLPDLTGKSYGNGGEVSNLYRFVDRENRILYEERESHGILLSSGGSVEEGGTVNVAIQLRKAAAEDVVINLVGSGSATYNDDYTISVGGRECDPVTEMDCSITIMADETVADDEVVITINNDGRGEGAETIVLSSVVASGDTSLTGRPLVITIPEDPPLVRVSIARSGSGSVAEGDTVDLDIRLGEMLEEDVTVYLVGSDSTATYGSSNDWTLSVGGTDCSMVTEDNCSVTITAGQTSPGDVVVTINDDGRTNELAESIVLSVEVDSGSTDLVQAGSPFTLNIPDDPPLPTVSLSTTNSSSISEGNTATITLTLSEALGSNATFNLIEGGTGATYGTSNDWNLSVGGTDCNMATQANPCQVTINANATTAEVTVEVNTDTTPEAREDFTVSVAVDSGSTSLVLLGSPSSVDFNIPDHRPTVSLNTNDDSIREFATRVMTIELSEAISQPVTLNIVADDGTAVISTDFVLHHRTPSGSGNFTECTSVTGSSCQVTIAARNTNADIRIRSTSGAGKTIIVEIQIPQANQNIVAPGSPTRREFPVFN